MLSRTEEYAVRAVTHLATYFGQRAVNAEDVASSLGAPQNYMSKTLNALVRHGILTSARGPGGGFSLAVAPDILTVADVVDVFADARPLRARCLLGNAMCDPARPCAAHLQWTELTVAAREPLLRATIGALCANRPGKAIVEP